ncbi:MAG: element excision factor XisI family protein [Microscillaceae bacterium]|nr:element excision factor XisI family protein [Microscillaceae bacterium]
MVTYVAGLSDSEEDGVEYQLITDDEHGHYLYFGVGWEKDRHWIYAIYVHIDVKSSGKVWLQHDGTDLRIAELLHQKGIPKNDMVIGFQAPHIRKMMSEYAEK